MTDQAIYKLTNYFIAAVWLVNGLFCKVLNLVPRHREIVERILGPDYSNSLTLLIGLAEIGMAAWILSGIKARLIAVTQIALVLLMNIIEFSMASDLLLWGSFNIVFALMFASFVYYREFILGKKLKARST